MAVKPDYSDIANWDSFCHDISVEYTQCYDEGLDVEKYKVIFDAAANLPEDENRVVLTDALYEIVNRLPQRDNYNYNEPSDLKSIKQLRKAYPVDCSIRDENVLKNKIAGAVTGRICGCLLGKPVEGIRTEDFYPLLKQTGNYPLHRYILSSDITSEISSKSKFNLEGKCFADTVCGMPVDDDTNYILLSQLIVDDFGRDFKPSDVASSWLKYQGRNAYFTAERVAYDNFVKGYAPPQSAVYKNPYREWIGAQIRGDYFGYINPGNPEKAAEMAFNDACISHTKNGIYGEMFASAMIACAAVTNEREAVLRGGLAQIPATSRLYEAVDSVICGYNNGVTYDECIARIHSLFDEHTGYGWCHTIPNAMIVAAAIMYGEGDYGKSICMAVQPCFDTDCNGATVGSVLGMMNGVEAISEEWQNPLQGVMHTSVFGFLTVKIQDIVEKTYSHLI